jgi:hypothetical protein
MSNNQNQEWLVPPQNHSLLWIGKKASQELPEDVREHAEKLAAYLASKPQLDPQAYCMKVSVTECEALTVCSQVEFA